MDKREYNLNVKRLQKRYNALQQEGHKIENSDTESWNRFYKVQDILAEDLKTLYYADTNFEYANKASVLILLRLNLSLRAIPLHVFGISIK